MYNKSLDHGNRLNLKMAWELAAFNAVGSCIAQAVKLKIFGTRPNWVVSYIAYTKFHTPRHVFHSPAQIFTRIGDQASTSFPACCIVKINDKGPLLLIWINFNPRMDK